MRSRATRNSWYTPCCCIPCVCPDLSHPYCRAKRSHHTSSPYLSFSPFLPLHHKERVGATPSSARPCSCALRTRHMPATVALGVADRSPWSLMKWEQSPLAPSQAATCVQRTRLLDCQVPPPPKTYQASSGNLTSTSHIVWAALMTKCGQHQTTRLLNMLDMPGIPQRGWKKAEGSCWPACVLHATCHLQLWTQPNATHNITTHNT